MKRKKQMSIEIDKKISTSYLQLIKDVFRRHNKFVLIIVMLLSLNVGANNSSFSARNDTELSLYPVIVRQRLHNDLVKEVKGYINQVAPTSKLNADTLVNICQRYDMNISFVLAQGMLESNLGTKGKALTTKSVFGVGALDNGTIRPGCIYKHVNESIEPYLKLLIEQYLGDKKTIKDLIRDGGFKTLKGSRYATLSTYESRLRTWMVHVDMHTSINMYQDVINLSDEEILAYFGPLEEESLDNSNLQANLQ